MRPLVRPVRCSMTHRNGNAYTSTMSMMLQETTTMHLVSPIPDGRVRESDRRPFHWAVTATFLYLTLPLFIFFALLVRFSLAIPACILIVWLTRELVCSTAWGGLRTAGWQSAYFFSLAAAWVW